MATTLRIWAAGLELDWHVAPVRELAVYLTGRGEIEASDGTIRLIEPGTTRTVGHSVVLSRPWLIRPHRGDLGKRCARLPVSHSMKMRSPWLATSAISRV